MANEESASVRFRYVDVDGVTHDVTAQIGDTLMTVATSNLIRGIDGDCGGNCACGTCHVVIDEALASKLGPSNNDERELLAFIGHGTSQGHRLGCQVTVTPALEGALISVAKPL